MFSGKVAAGEKGEAQASIFPLPLKNRQVRSTTLSTRFVLARVQPDSLASMCPPRMSHGGHTLMATSKELREQSPGGG